MRILVIGLGSMGKRRIRLIQNGFPEHELAGIDTKQERRESVNIPTFASLDDAASQFRPDCAFVCTSPLSHNSIIRSCLQKGLHVFTEINLVKDGYDENMALAKEKGKVLFLSSTFLYRNEIIQIQKELAGLNEPILYTYHVGQYLPDWHPWEAYNQFFLGDKRTNGCREILAINLPWIFKTFGPVEEYTCMRRKMTGLNIQYDDSYILTMKHKGGNMGVFVADLVSREAACKLRIESENALITWEGKADSLSVFDVQTKTHRNIKAYQNAEHQDGYSANIVENAYKAEIEAFFLQIRNGNPAAYTMADDLAVIDLIDRIELEKD